MSGTNNNVPGNKSLRNTRVLFEKGRLKREFMLHGRAATSVARHWASSLRPGGIPPHYLGFVADRLTPWTKSSPSRAQHIMKTDYRQSPPLRGGIKFESHLMRESSHEQEN